MSGEATGWVLREGPPDRAMRLVLVAIADAANADGQHAHPGNAAICRATLYSPAHVRRVLAQLKEDGWVHVEAYEHGGRGMATVYAIPGVKRAHDERVLKGNALIPAPKRAHFGAKPAHPDERPTGFSNGFSNRGGDQHVRPDFTQSGGCPKCKQGWVDTDEGLERCPERCWA